MGILKTSTPFVSYSSVLMRFVGAHRPPRANAEAEPAPAGGIQPLLSISYSIQVLDKHIFCRFA